MSSGVETNIDEFFDEHLERVLGAPPANAAAGSWYPPTDKGVVKVKVEVSGLPAEDKLAVRAADSSKG